MEKAGGNRRLALALLLAFGAALLWSLIKPKDLFTWFLEVAPALIGVVILVATYKRFPFTSLAYVIMFAHALILIVGGHYTYAEMPLFNWIRDTFHLARNDYDRLGHFFQGFSPAIVSREVLLRTSPLKRGGWLFFIVICICLAISATYELLEWRVSVAMGASADAFLGTQGDPWDTQWDMTWALIGAAAALLLLGRLHDRYLDRLARSN
ncbi:MAG TPA: DUF2238 domain-containing protein [Bryobacterales bacterium]|nr:DUF2238 domain-containing protein [Bryobacterales bacterium]